jgi:hypothetical protein
LAGGLGHRQTGNRHQRAQTRLSLILAMEVGRTSSTWMWCGRVGCGKVSSRLPSLPQWPNALLRTRSILARLKANASSFRTGMKLCRCARSLSGEGQDWKRLRRPKSCSCD